MPATGEVDATDLGADTENYDLVPGRVWWKDRACPWQPRETGHELGDVQIFGQCHCLIDLTSATEPVARRQRHAVDFQVRLRPRQPAQ